MDLDHLQRDDHLSRIETLWGVVDVAHRGPDGEAADARRELLRRYGAAAHRYLLGATRDPDVADELFQEFALRFVRGDFRRADPGRGRFRDLVKSAIFHLVVDHYKRQKRRPLPLVDEAGAVDLADDAEGDDPEFDRRWRDELLARAWSALEESQRRTGRPDYDILRFRSEHPDLSSAAMAEQLGAQLGRPMNAPAVRQALHRARERFADLLLAEVARSLGDGARDRIEQELIDLNLLEYCRPALQRRSGG